MSPRRALLWAFLLFLAPLLLAADAPRDATTYFYLQPDPTRAMRLVRDLEVRGQLRNPDSRPHVAGFLAALFLRHPEIVTSWTAERFAPETETTVAAALLLAGRAAEAEAHPGARQRPADPQTAVLFVGGDLRRRPVETPSDLDALWGAAFATGDAAWPARILDRIETGLGPGGHPVEDLLPLSELRLLRRSDARAYVAEFRARLGEERFREAYLLGTAVWGAVSNAEQHDFVAELLQGRIAADLESPFGQLFRRAQLRRGATIVVSGEGRAVRGQMGFVKNARFIVATVDEMQLRYPDAVYRQFRNDFSSKDSVTVALLLLVPPGRTGAIRLQVTPPSDPSFALPAVAYDGGSQQVIRAYAVPLQNLRMPGVYGIEARVDDDGGELTLASRFLLVR